MFYKTIHIQQKSKRFSPSHAGIILMLLVLTLLFNYADTPSGILAAPGVLNQTEAPLLEVAAPLICTPTDVGGHVYREFKMNGEADPELYETDPFNGQTRLIRYAELPLAGTTINVYDDNGGLVGSTVSVADGSWEVDVSTVTGSKVRVEFSEPTNYQSGPSGSNNATSVAFPDVGDCDVDFTAGQPCDHCQDDPAHAVITFVRNNAALTSPAIRTLPSSEGIPHVSRDPSGGVTWGIPQGTLPQAALTTVATVGDIGTTFGLDWDRLHQVLYTSAYDRAFATMADDGVGGKREAAIYSVTPAGATALWLDLETLLGSDIAGIDPPQNTHPGGSVYGRTEDSNVNLIGYTSLGSLKLSNDNSEMYIVNLRSREVYIIPIATDGSPPSSAGDITVFPLPDAPSCSGTWADELEPGVNRPHTAVLGLGVHPDNGLVYATVTCTGPTLTDVVGHVYSFDPTDTTPSVSDFTHELSVPLHLEQTAANPNRSNWYNFILHEWESVPANITFYKNQFNTDMDMQHSQPWLGEVEFDIQPDGSVGMILSSRNRYHDLINGSMYVAGGQIFRACNTGSVASPVWTLEVEGICGNYTTGNNLTITPLADYSNTHSKFFGDVGREGEMAAGTLAQIPGFAEVVVPSTDNVFNSATSGLAWISNQNGTRSRDARIFGDYSGGGYSATPFTKANNWGDVEVLCDPAPIEIGNRVWNDGDSDGIQDPVEAGISGIAVTLHDSSGTQIGSVVTDANGNYFFSSDPNRTDTPSADYDIAGLTYNTADFEVRIDTAQPILSGMILTIADVNSGANSDLRDSDATLNGGNVIITLATGGVGANSHTHDIGFYPPDADRGDLPSSFDTMLGEFGPWHMRTDNLYLGSCVDRDADGQPDAEAGVDGSGGDDNNIGSPVSGSCTNDDDEDGVTLTTPLIAGTQACVEVDALNSGAAAYFYGWIDFNGDGDFDGDADDLLSTGDFASGSVAVNGNLTDQQYCFTVPVAAAFDGGETHMRFRLTRDDLSGSLTPWNGAASDGEVEDYWQPLACIGNYVWDDLYGTTPDVQDANDTPLSGMAVRLVWADGNGIIDTGAGDAVAQGDDVLYTTTTDTNGAYQFCGLVPDDYQVQITTPPGGSPQVVTPDQGGNDVTDSDGSQPGGTGMPVSSPAFTIPDPTNTLPTGENGNEDNPGSLNNYPDNQDDLTLDFGFGPAQVAIGDYVWRDTDGNGLQDGGEPGIEGVTVQLLDSGGNPALCVLGSNGVSGNYADNFESNGPSGSVGSLTWANDWQLTGAVTWPSVDGDLAMRLDPAEIALREFDMTAFPFGTATFSYVYRFASTIGAGDTVTVDYFDGSIWNTLVVYDDTTDPTVFTAQSFTINSTSANTQIRFSSNAGGEIFYVDDVDVSGTVPGPVTDITDASGLYRFDQYDCLLPSTTYQIVIGTNQTPLLGLIPTTQDAGGDSSNNPATDTNDSDAVISGNNAVISPAPAPASGDNLGYDFGFTTVGIGNYVWRDADGNGLQDGGESGIEGVTVQLLDNGSSPALCYLGSHGVPGNYADDFESNDSSGSVGSLTWTNDWQLTGAVTWPSVDGDLAMRLDPAEVALREFDMTAFPFGTATFSYAYRFASTIGTGDTVTVDYFDGTAWNTLVVYDSTTDPTSFTAQSFTINSISANTQIRFSSNAGGEIFYVDDVDISGTVSGPVSNVTNAAGLYMFDGSDCLAASTNYQVVIDTTQTPVAGLDLTTRDADSVTSNDPVDDDTDSDAAISGTDAVINPAPSPATGENPSYDFGFTTAVIGNYVWRDADGNGLQDGGESGIEGVTVQLLDNGGSPALCYLGSHGVPGNYADDFESNGSSGSVGSLTWANDWQLTGAVTWPSIDGDLTMNFDNTEGALREFDMTAFPFGMATFSYAYRFGNGIDSGETVTVDYFDGSTWHTLVVYDNSTDLTAFTAQSFTINSASANTQIRFISNASGEDFYVDDVEISGTVSGPVSNVTDAAGLYMFDGSDCLAASTNYQVVIDTIQTPLLGINLTTQNAGGVISNDPVADDTDSDAAMSGTDAVINLAPSPATGENPSYDFGFTTVSIGNYVWRDADGNGLQDGGESGIENVTVQLLDSGGSPALCVLGSHGVPGNYADDFESNGPSGSVGNLTWANDWQLTGAVTWPTIDGDLTMRLDYTEEALREFDMTAFPFGTATFSYAYRFASTIGTGDTVTVDYFDGTAWNTLVVYDSTTDPTTFTAQSFTINSTSANTQIRFISNAGSEIFYVDDVDISGTIPGSVSNVTDVAGLYMFDGGDCLAASTNYQIVIDTDQATLTGFILTAQDAGGIIDNDPVADDTDSDAAMVGADAVINPASSPATGENPGYDFGFATVAIGNYVWNDTNGDGLQDGGEAGIENVTVQLLDSGGSPALCHLGSYGLPGNYADDFQTNNWSGSTGSEIWTADWVRSGTTSIWDFSGDYAARVEASAVISREFDMTVFPTGTATFSYAYRFGTTIGGGDTVTVDYFDGSAWHTLVVYDETTDPIVFTAQSFTINSTAVNTQIRFSSNAGGENFYVDDVDVSGTIAGPVTDVTDADGLYLFDGSGCLAPSTTYRVVVDTVQVSLTGLGLTAQNAGGVISNDPVADDTDSDAAMVGADAVINPAPSPVIGENPSYDFGFFAATDWGDLPDTAVGTSASNYNTDSGDNGPSHLLDGSTYLGSCVDVEGNGQPDTEAGYDVVGGDDGNSGVTTGTCAVAGDDEDGVDSPVGLGNGIWGDGTGDLNITGLVGSGCLVAWVDWNSDGDFDDAPNGVSELIYASSLASGAHALTFSTQTDSTHGGSYSYPGVLNARFRLFTDAQLSAWGVACDSAGVSSRYTGSAIGGEVEDYQWSFNSPTAVSLSSISAATPSAPSVIIFILVLGLLLAAVTVTAVYGRRHQIH